MKLLSCILSIVLFASSAAFAETIITSSGTRVLPSLTGVKTENGLRQAERITKIVFAELTAENAYIGEEITALNKDKADYGEENTTLGNIQANLNTDIADHFAALADQRAQVVASNNLPPEHRDQANVNRLTEWRDILNQRSEDLNNRQADLIARIDRANAVLETIVARESELRAKMGLAYRQLQFCVNYATKIRKKLQTSFNAGGQYFAPGEALNGAMEDLKALSDAKWGTP